MCVYIYIACSRCRNETTLFTYHMQGSVEERTGIPENTVKEVLRNEVTFNIIINNI